MSDSQVALVKQKTDIVSVIDARVKLVRAGKNLKANCPFHGEKTPSFFVSPEMQTFKCFGCGEGGDVFTFLQKYEGMDFPEALEHLAAKAGVVLERDMRSSDEGRRKLGLEILHMAEEYYRYLLIEHTIGKRALAYLAERGIGPGLIKTFGLGYAANSWQGVHDFLVKKKKYTVDEVERVGLLIRSTGGRYYDRFRGRVMFPLKDFTGKTVGFSGRVLPGEDVDSSTGSGRDEKEAKYINSPETEWYHKGQMLYGLSEVRSVVRKKNRVIIVEGELDMISSYGAGVREVVAIKGSALTVEQIELLRRLTSNVVLALDADGAGSEATKRGIVLADSMGMNLAVVEITAGKDPDELARKNPEAWKALVKSPVSVYDFLIHRAFSLHEAAGGEGKKAISRELAPVLSRIGNAVEREYYLGVVAERLGVSKAAVNAEVAKAAVLGKSEEQKGSKKTEVERKDRRYLTEQFVLASFLQLSGSLEGALRVKSEWFSQEGFARLWQQIVELVRGRERMGVKELVARLPAESQRLLHELFVPQVVVDQDKPERVVELFEKGTMALEQLVLREKMAHLAGVLEKLGDDEAARNDWQEEYAVVTARLKELTG